MVRPAAGCAEEVMRAVVALVEAGPETIIEDYDRVLGWPGWTGYCLAGPVALVAQAVPGGWFPGAGSPPWQLDGVLTWLAKRSAFGPGRIPPARGGRVADLAGRGRLCRRAGAGTMSWPSTGPTLPRITFGIPVHFGPSPRCRP